jgi:thiol-disulfide isomerase/thioredoxin
MPPDARDQPGLIRTLAHRLAGESWELPDEGRIGSFEGATAWLNSEPLTAEVLRGGVVLVDFWTYTCVNWLRTLPYVRAWAAKYRDAGLRVIGVHTPEFGFEHDIENVQTHAAALQVEFPIVLDNDYAVWQSFANHFWPAVYLVDADGRIRYHHFGEGEYAATEMAIQQLLRQQGREVDPDLVMVEPHGLEVAADWRTLRSSETYVGYGQYSRFAQERDAQLDAPADYVAPTRLPVNTWALQGNWTLARHAAVLNEPGGRVAFQFEARDVNLVMGPIAKDRSIPFRVLLDGQPAGDATGTDVMPDSTGAVDGQGTYQLIRQRGPIGDRRFEIEFEAPGVEVYCFTFG